MAVVKANAYGHGAVEVSRAALSAGAVWLAVSRVGEALELRKAGIQAPILVTGGAVPEEVGTAVDLKISLPLYDAELAKNYAERARETGRPLRVHLKVETGLGRFGVFPEEVLSLARLARSMGGLEIEGIYTQLAMADVRDHPLTLIQLRRFRDALDSLQSEGIVPQFIHAANSAAAFHYPESRFNLVRVGQAVVGLGTGREDLPFPAALRRAFNWKASLVSSKTFPGGWGISYGVAHTTHAGERIGVIPVGHGDGFRRAAGNQVIIAGRKVDVIGKVCIDQCMVQLPDRVPLGTEAVVMGSQGDLHIFPEELSQRWNIPLTGVTNVDRRVPRVYIRDED